MRQSELLALHERIQGLTASSPEVNADIASALGWTNLTYDKWGSAYRGDNPKTGTREIVPDFTGATDAAVSMIPENWIEGYFRRIDGMIVAYCTPCGETGLTRPKVEGTDIARCMASVAILALAFSAREKSPD